MDVDFEDSISGLTNLDYDKRLTAEQALNRRCLKQSSFVMDLAPSKRQDHTLRHHVNN